MSERPQVIRLLLMDGDASCRWKCELSNWDGMAYRIPRTMIQECSNLNYVKTPGVYFLIGREGQTDCVYIGEAENVISRMNQHIVNDKWQGWTECVIFVSSNKSLNKAKAKYMESSLYSLAQDVGRCRLKNSVCPTKSGLSESDSAEMDGYLSNLCLLLGVMGHRFLEPAFKDEVHNGIRLYTSSPKSGFDAEGLAVPDGFVVLKGSRVSNSICKSFNGCGYHRLRERLESDGIIVDGVFVKNHLFDSPSAASSVVRGAGSDGLTVWKTKDGKTLKQVRGPE